MSLAIENQKLDSKKFIQTHKKMKKRFHDMHEYMCFLFEDVDGYIEIKAIRVSNNNDVKTFYVSKIEDIPIEKLMSLNKRGYNIYAGVGRRKDESGGKKSVSDLSALWLDIDLNPDEDMEARLNDIENICKNKGLKYSLILISGHGLHLYFKLLNPLKNISTEDIQEIEAKVKWLEQVYGGDSVSDVSRLMRIPGFYNMKNPHEPKMCSILSIDPEVKYELSAFNSAEKVISKSDLQFNMDNIPDKVPERFLELLKTNPKLEETWRGKRKDMNDKTGSGHDMALASMLKNEGFTYEEIAKCLLETPYEKKTPRNERYFRQTFSKIEANKEKFDMISSTNTGLTDLTDFTLKDEDLDKEQFEYIIKGFLPKKSLGMITSKAGVGKSIFGYALTKQLILKGYMVVIVDADMSVNVIGDRLRKAQLRQYMDSQLFYVHHSRVEIIVDYKNKNWNEFKTMLKRYKDCIVIFDNLKDLSKRGLDLDRDTGVKDMMDEYKQIREMGNTVIILHHVPKDGSRKHPFKNSGSIADKIDYGYLLERKEEEFTLHSFKDRVLELDKNVRFILEPDFTLMSEDTKQEISEYKTVIKVYKYIRSLSDEKSEIQQKDITEGMKGTIARDRLRELLENWEGKLWKMRKGSKTSRFYSHIELTPQNSKSLHPYIREKLGILEFKDEDSSPSFLN